MAGKYGIIREAIEGHSCLLARHRGIWLTLAPYALGWRDEHPYLVAYAAAGVPGWLCLRVAELSDLRSIDAPWTVPYAPPDADMEMDVFEVLSQETAPEKIAPPLWHAPACSGEGSYT